MGDLKAIVPAAARILIIKLRSIGDVVLSTAAFQVVKEQLPRCHLSVLVEPPAHELIAPHPLVDQVVVFDRRRYGGLAGQVRFLLSLRRQRFDLAIDLHGGPRSAVWTGLCGAPLRAGMADSRRSFAYNLKMRQPHTQVVHALEFQLGLLQGLGLNGGKPTPWIPVPPSLQVEGDELLRRVGVEPTEEFVAIHPGVRNTFDRWQAEKFAQVADTVVQCHGIKVVFLSGPGQRGLVEEITMQMQTPPRSLAEQTSLLQYAAICKRAALLLCHNGGQMHIGAAVGAPVVALFGATHPQVYRPWGEGHVVCYKHLPCSPCNPATRFADCRRGQADCKRLISAAEVLEAVRGILRRREG